VKVIDCDTHFWQPFPVIEGHIEPAWRERIREALGQVKTTAESTTDKAARAAYERPMDAKIASADSWVGIKERNERAMQIRGGDHPDARIEWMDSEGIDACIIYPTLAATLAFNPDAELASAACRALNRWSSDFASYAPERLKPCLMLPWYDPQRALKELDFALKLGLKVAFATPTSPAAHRWSDRAYDPLWKALQDNGVVMTFHEFTRIPTATSNRVVRDTYRDSYSMMYLCGHTLEAQLTVMDLMFGGVFNRFPKLPIVFVEAHIAWLPGWLASLDQQWNRAKSTQDLSDWVDADLTPTELFRRQGLIVAFPDDLWVQQTVDHLSAENVLICSDYPHPQARYNVVRQFSEKYPALAPDVRNKILGGNAAKIFGLQ
jgi:predicted TIM-barrel fold metal-dependent hydrolase